MIIYFIIIALTTFSLPQFFAIQGLFLHLNNRFTEYLFHYLDSGLWKKFDDVHYF